MNPKASYVWINQSKVLIPKEIMKQSMGISEDIGKVLKELK